MIFSYFADTVEHLTTQVRAAVETDDRLADRLRREEAALFEEGGMSALSGEEYRRTLERALADPATRATVSDLPWGAGTGFVRSGAVHAGFVFCACIADHPTPWFRYVPVTSDYQVERAESGQAIVIDDTLTCLAHANPTDPTTPSVFAADEHQDLYEAAFDAWAAAKAHIHVGWVFNADPANFTRPIPRIMRDAADLVRTKGAFLGDRQEDMVERLEAPHAPRIQRAVRDILTGDRINDRTTVTQLLTLAHQLGLIKQPAPEPLPPITPDDIHLVCWTAVTPGQGPLPGAAWISTHRTAWSAIAASPRHAEHGSPRISGILHRRRIPSCSVIARIPTESASSAAMSGASRCTCPPVAWPRLSNELAAENSAVQRCAIVC